MLSYLLYAIISLLVPPVKMLALAGGVADFAVAAACFPCNGKLEARTY